MSELTHSEREYIAAALEHEAVRVEDQYLPARFRTLTQHAELLRILARKVVGEGGNLRFVQKVGHAFTDSKGFAGENRDGCAQNWPNSA